MLESEAKTKICPMSLTEVNDNSGPVCCHGPNCMAWEAWTDPVYETVKLSNGTTSRKFLEARPKDPPQGHWGMIPPELNCDH